MPLVEIIMGENTSDLALAKAFDYTKQIRKTPIVVNDSWASLRRAPLAPIWMKAFGC